MDSYTNRSKRFYRNLQNAFTRPFTLEVTNLLFPNEFKYFENGYSDFVKMNGKVVGFFKSLTEAQSFYHDLKHFLRIWVPLKREYDQLGESIDLRPYQHIFSRQQIDEAKQYRKRRRAALKNAMASIHVADAVVWLGGTILGRLDGDGAIRRKITRFL